MTGDTMQIEQQPKPAAHDGSVDDMIRRALTVKVMASEEPRAIDVIASTPIEDAHHDIVVQDWDLTRYSANPVVLWNHNREGWMEAIDPKDALPIGYAKNVGVVDGKLQATLVFVDEKANPIAEMVYQGFVQGSIRAVSVGFKSRTVLEEKVDEKERYRLMGNELYEISAVPMGANPEAVARQRTKALAQLKALARPAKQAVKEATMDTNKTAPTGTAQAQVTEAVPAEPVTQTTSTDVAADTAKAFQAKVDDLTHERDALRVQVKALSDERDEAKASLASMTALRDAAESALLTRSVDDLVGVKFLPAQRDAMLSLAKSDKKAFDAIVDASPDLRLLGEAIPAATAKAAAPASATDELFAHVTSLNISAG